MEQIAENPYAATATAVCAIVGAIKILKFSYSCLAACNRHLLRCDQNLYAKYAAEGKSSYAVVTGGSDGIGLEICH